MTSPAQFDLPEPLLEAALARLVGETDERADAALAELVAAHPEHAARLRALRQALDGASRLLAKSVAAPEPEQPAWIDGYRVVRRLGEGGFGVVHLCEQDEPIHRQVAIKVLRPGAGDRGTLQRFAAERQLLAGFRHPAIASVFAAGSLPDGRPYFVMEYVDGAPITDYADRDRLTLAQRLALFLELCTGVAHAHARGIVHRDLKPANVLVTRCDGKAMCKIIDFGVAKALRGAGDPGGPDPTATGRVIGTPGYMSPEQANGEGSAVDARTDVFALGVILYELLTGALPWPRGARSSTNGPQRPSTRLLREPGIAEIAAARATEPRALAYELRSELDWIVLKALDPDRERRYGNAQALAEDLDRYMHDRPVCARPPSLGYRLRKRLRRHRVRVAVGLALVAAGLGIAGMSLFRRDALAAERDGLVAIQHGVEKLIERAFDPRLGDTPHIDELQRDALHDALALHDRALQTKGASAELRGLRVHVLNGIADVHYRLGQYAESIVLSTEAETEAGHLLREPGPRPDLPAGRGRAQRNLARCLMLLGKIAQAAPWSESAAAAFEQLHASDPARHANLLSKTLIERASCCAQQGDGDGALAAQRRAIDVLERHLVSHPGHEESIRDVIRGRCGLAGMLSSRGDLAAAHAAVLAARALADSPQATDDERAIVSRRLALVHEARGEKSAAAEELALAADLVATVLQQHPGRVEVRHRLREVRTSLAEMLFALGRGEAAEREAALAIDVAESLPPGPDGWPRQLADTLLRSGWAVVGAQWFAAFARAEGWLRQAEQIAASIATTRDGRAVQAQARIALGFASRDLGRPFPVADWQAAVACAREFRPDVLAIVQLELARRHREVGDLASARAVLAEIAAGAAPAWQIAREQCRIALAAGEPAAAVELAEVCLEETESWATLQFAAEVMTAAALQAGRQQAAGAATFAERADTLWRRFLAAVDAAPDSAVPDRLRELFTAQAHVHLARLAPDAADTAGALAAHLPVLDRLRGNVEASRWDETPWAAGHTLSIRAALLRSDLASAEAELAAFAAAVAEAAHALDAAALWADLARAAALAAPEAGRAPAASAAAITALRRAVELGLRDRRDLLDAPALAALRALPEFAAVVATVPQ